MTRQRTLFWTLTGLVALAMAASGALYLLDVGRGQGDVLDNFGRLGYGPVMAGVLGVAKILGATALVVGGVTGRFPTLVEWAYAGFTFVLVGAAVSHLAAGDGVGGAAPPLVVLALLAGSHALRARRAAAVVPTS